MNMKAGIVAVGLAVALGCAGVAAASHGRDGAVIRNSGSTNFSGYTIKVWSDGSTWAVHSNRAGGAVDTPVTGRIPADLARRFLDDARQASSNRVVAQSCMKSVSFGTTTVVRYHGWTSPDLECPGGGYVVTLAADAHKVAALLKIQGLPAHPIHMLPNEPRRVPTDTSSSQASPTPEPTPSAS